MIRFSSSTKRLYPYMLTALLCAVSVFRMILEFNITNDSTFYLTAAKNLVEKGELTVYSNWPSHSLLPEMEKYTEYPPGFPVYLAVFILIFKDQFIAAVAAQAVAVVLLFLSLHRLIYNLKLSFVTVLFLMLFITFNVPFKLITVSLWSETLFMALTFFAFYFSIKLIHEGNSAKNWIYSLIFLFLAGSVRFIGILNAAIFLLPVLSWGGAGGKKTFRALSVIVAASLPIILWMLRNKILYGITTESHGLGTSADAARMLDPLVYLYKIFNWNMILSVSFLLLTLVVIILPFIVKIHKESRVIYSHLLMVSAVYLTGTYIISLFATFDSINDRILAPAVLFLTITLFISIDIIFKKLNEFKYRFLVFLLPVLLMTNKNFFDYRIGFSLSIEYPAEKYLWEEIDKISSIRKASHFYTDYNYHHQLFCKKPHRVIYSESLNDQMIMKLQAVGIRPFFLFKSESNLNNFIETHYGYFKLKKTEFPESGFVLYSPVE